MIVDSTAGVGEWGICGRWMREGDLESVLINVTSWRPCDILWDWSHAFKVLFHLFVGWVCFPAQWSAMLSLTPQGAEKQMTHEYFKRWQLYLQSAQHIPNVKCASYVLQIQRCWALYLGWETYSKKYSILLVETRGNSFCWPSLKDRESKTHVVIQKKLGIRAKIDMEQFYVVLSENGSQEETNII